MSLYDFRCQACGNVEEFLVSKQGRFIFCELCGSRMLLMFPGNQMVKMKGEGGYPSRRRQIFNTTKRLHPKLT